MSVNGLISNIQKYSTKDGPGIRSTVFLIGCNLRCKWCANPEAMYPNKKIMYYSEKCKKCGCCVEASNNNSIILGDNGCSINRDLCDNIFSMPDICPYDAYEEKGYYLNPNELYKKLLRDKTFYDNSGGGVTFSGGEPLLQNKFLYETIKLLKNDSIHIAIDTAGLWDFESVKNTLILSDLILFDIKAFDKNIHHNCTGVYNDIIMENAKLLAKMKKDMYIRMVIVPTLNDNMDDIIKRLEFIKDLGSSVKKLDILKYHNFGEGKYVKLGLKYPLAHINECNDDIIEKIKLYAESLGLSAEVMN